MNRKTLEYFVTLAHTLSFTKAANKHFIAQTTMSRQIALLEEQLGFELFERDTTKVVLTQAGEVYLEDVKLLLKEYDNAVKRAAIVAGKQNGILRAGHSADLGQKYLGKALNIFQEKNAEVEIQLSQFSQNELLRKLSEGKLDVIAVFEPGLIGLKNIDAIRICEFGIIIGVSKNHRFAKRKSVDSIELAQETICSVMKRNAPYLYEFSLESCRKDGYEPRFLEVDSFDNQKLAAQLGKAVAFFPDSELYNKNEDELKYIKLKNTCHKYVMDFAWSTQNDNPYLKDFISLSAGNINFD